MGTNIKHYRRLVEINLHLTLGLHEHEHRKGPKNKIGDEHRQQWGKPGLLRKCPKNLVEKDIDKGHTYAKSQIKPHASPSFNG